MIKPKQKSQNLENQTKILKFENQTKILKFRKPNKNARFFIKKHGFFLLNRFLNLTKKIILIEY